MSGIYSFGRPSFVYTGQHRVIDLVSEESQEEEASQVERVFQPIPPEEFGHEPLTNGSDINPEAILEAETTSLSAPLTRHALKAYKKGKQDSKRSRTPSEESSEERPTKKARVDLSSQIACETHSVPLSLVSMLRDESSCLEHDILDLQLIIDVVKRYKAAGGQNEPFIQKTKALLRDVADRLHKE